MRALTDYVLGFLLVLGGMAIFSAGANALGLTIALVCVLVGALLIVGRLIGGRNVDRQD